ncbi:hypothetical protein QFC22_001916 [Naganishia vaughanmartiniae]|uniref:Uncharacterized protein n=1 Tax=Naganishia vaughanmartiniae TaxID=1424756 RepID=A0ACC2XF93_9TREE|nr:hypothetical protein QFC22_001916 [Naganishia vaughanmartiniae]
MAEQESSAGILSAVTSVAQSATSVVSNALEAMHITAANTEEDTTETTETEDKKEVTENGDKDETDLEDGEIRESNGHQAKDGEKTVFDDATAFDLKHPLSTPWTLFYGTPNLAKNLPKKESGETVEKAASWMEDIRKVITFDSVEEFWGLHNNIVQPSGLVLRADYYLMRDGVLPAWEDPVNKHGGKWAVQFPRDKTRDRIDQMWLYTILAAIGETFETDAGDSKDYSSTPDQSYTITGVILNARPNFYRVNIWTKDAPEDLRTPSPSLDRILKIGRHFKQEVLGFALDSKLPGASSGPGGFSTDVEFQSHKESSKKSKDPAKKIIL